MGCARRPSSSAKASPDLRLDVYLHKVCLFKSRTYAGEACDRGKVTLDGAPAKPSKIVQPGVRIAIDLGTGPLEVEVLDVPAGNISKKMAPAYYRVLRDERGQEWP